jgi:hypothetical protein
LGRSIDLGEGDYDVDPVQLEVIDPDLRCGCGWSRAVR